MKPNTGCIVEIQIHQPCGFPVMGKYILYKGLCYKNLSVTSILAAWTISLVVYFRQACVPLVGLMREATLLPCACNAVCSVL